MGDEREARIGANEALFRDVNERIEDVNESFGLLLDDYEFVCECGVLTCTERIRLTRQEYERVRAKPRWFLVSTGHENDDLERVVERREGYNVVEKNVGAPAEIAEELDPRS